MKMMRSVLAINSMLVLFLCYSCEKSGKEDQPPPHRNGTINADVYGRVTDDNNVPVQGATVKAGLATTTTDLNGYFRFKKTSLDKVDGFIKVEKEGFFLGSRTFTPTETATSYISIQLIKKYLTGAFVASSGGQIDLPSANGSINFPANGIVNRNNQAYTGNVSVYAYFINPQVANFREIMPGALRGLNTSNQAVSLKSYGMMAVELTSASGEQLQLASGKSATITFLIPSKLLPGAPATIPLWHFNDTTGIWKQEGSAAKQGTNYVGNVSHFSFWNCDDPFPVVDLALTIKDQTGAPLRFMEVVLRIPGDSVNPSGNGYTDSLGRVSGPVPLNKTMQMTVLNRCNTVLHTRQVGPFATDTDLGTITISNNNAVEVTITGTVVNCTGNPIGNAIVNVLLNGQNTRATVTNTGAYSITIPRCEASATTATLTAIDVATSEQGNPVNVQVTSGNANGGQLSACGNTIAEFINYSLLGKNVLLVTGDYLTLDKDTDIYVSGSTQQQQNYIQMIYTGTGLGTFPVKSLYVYTNQRFYNDAPVNVNITEYGNQNGYIAGNFTGPMRDTNFVGGPSGTIVCSFRLKRTF